MRSLFISKSLSRHYFEYIEYSEEDTREEKSSTSIYWKPNMCDVRVSVLCWTRICVRLQKQTKINTMFACVIYYVVLWATKRKQTQKIYIKWKRKSRTGAKLLQLLNIGEHVFVQLHSPIDDTWMYSRILYVYMWASSCCIWCVPQIFAIILLMALATIKIHIQRVYSIVFFSSTHFIAR